MVGHGRPAPTEGLRIAIEGTVQGVGFRPWVYRLATRRGLTGWVRNDAAGVTIEVSGDGAALLAFETDLTIDPPPAAVIRTVRRTRIPPRDDAGFTIVASDVTAGRRVSIPPDLATCDACLAEIRDPHNRRYRYPFTNCTNCGPRFTIARGVPYDRPTTTMAGFVMCADCEREYHDPGDRRFHAQPNACPVCGPRVWLCGRDGHEIASADPLRTAAARLRSGAIAAIKGLGGFHLACDAADPAAVAELRRRKRRDEKPFAIMVASLADAEALADLSDDERRLLGAVERPIVLAPRRAGAALADNVAPGNPTIGMMLPYTPLHHILLADAGRPLVMTSGNVSDEPIAYGNAEALSRLGAFADLFVLHDRDIDTRCDDSVARIVAGAPMLLRRSRGYTPRPIAVAPAFARPTLGCGGLLKNTFCLGTGEAAFLGPHIGDLENLETFEAYTHAVRRMLEFVGVVPEVVAHDLHPEYLSTTYALGLEAALVVPVQHHHAHVASVMAERGLNGPVLGVAYDGTGLGPDGTAWGGELLVADFAGYTRVATFRPIALAGGDAAIRQVWRQALAVLLDAFDGEPPLDRLPLFAGLAPREITVARQMLRQGINAPLAHGVGRYFDAAGALGLVRTVSRHEGQVALDWNLTADPSDASVYPYDIAEDCAPAVIDLRPAFRALACDLIGSVPPATVSARFHNTLAAATIRAVREQLGRRGRMPVVLSGGCFQNARLAGSIVEGLGSAVQVVLPRSVPPGDGGLALGQAAIANAVVRTGRLPASEE